MKFLFILPTVALVLFPASALRAVEPPKGSSATFDPVYDIDPAEAARNQHYQQAERPQFHYTPIQGHIGDATGLIFYKGEYHLFYMSDKWERRRNRHKCWGHAVSRDLLHWEELPSVLDPVLDHKPGSGSGFVDWGNALQLETGGEKTLAICYTDYQTGSCFAYSNDAGRTWTRHPRNPFLAGTKEIRDPKLFWYEPAKEWRLIRYEDKDFVFYRASNLFDWREQSRIGGYYECPDFFELPVEGSPGERKWALIGANASYRLGTYDGTTFHPETEMQLPELGRKFYAPQTWQTELEGQPAVIQMGFIPHEKGALLTWHNQMAFPVVLTLRPTSEGLRLCREPFAGIAKLRTDARTWQNLTVKSGGNPLAEVRGDVLEIRAEIEFGTARAFTFGVRGKTIHYAAGGQIDFSGAKVETAGAGRRVALQMLVDRSSIELFLDHGRASISRCVFFDPARQDFSLTSEDGDLRVISMEVNRLKSVWPDRPAPAQPPGKDGAAASGVGPDIVFADFEGADYGAWKVEGTAFGSAPTPEAMPGQKPVTGFLGRGLANSKQHGDGATGRLTSPGFSLQRKFITFLIGGGGWAGQTCLNLLVDDRVVRTATGPNTKPGGSSALRPGSWEVGEFAGQTARLEIVDSAKGGWGHITVDQIVFTDTRPPEAPVVAGTADQPHEPKAIAVPAESAEGELLYNGIQLPAAWPPRIKQVGTKTMLVPYLEHRPAVVPIDVGRQLFVDDFLIEKTDLQRQFHYPQRYAGNPILKPETPTERGEFGEQDRGGNLKPMAAMISDGFCYDAKEKRFKLWYQAGWRDGTMMATSEDGLHWTRPETDLEKGNNRVIPKLAKASRHGTGISFDPFTTDPAQRFKMLLYDEDKTHAYISPDGIHWDPKGPVTNCGDNATAFYNPFRQKWVISIRIQQTARNGRARNYREHKDFLQAIHWTPWPEGAAAQAASTSEEYEWAGTDPLDRPDPEMLAKIPGDKTAPGIRRLYGDPPQLYNLDAVAYESLMIGMFGILRGPTSGKVWDELKIVKRNDLHLAYSRDGFHWNRPDRTPFLACTRHEGDWENGYLHSGVGLFSVVGDQLYFYYSGWSGLGSKGPTTYGGGATGVAMLRRDGFASMDADAKGGTLTTRPVTFKGRYLFVNVAAPQGQLKVEALDEEGRVIAPFTAENSIAFSGDQTRQRLTWVSAADLSPLSGKKVRLRFTLHDGQLYAFWVSPDLSGASHGYIGAGGPGFDGLVDTVGQNAGNK